MMTGTRRSLLRAAPAPVTLILDNFTDANATALSSHTIAPTNTPATSWTVDVGAMTTQSNTLQTNGIDQYASCNCGDAEPTVTAIGRFIGGTADRSVGLLLRQSDVNNKWAYLIIAAAHNLYEVNAGVFTLRATGAITIVANTNYTQTFKANGTTIEGSISGLGATISYESSFNQAATKVGIYLTGNATVSMDDFQVVG